MEGEAGKGGAAGEAVGVGAGAKGRSSLSELRRKVCAVECSSTMPLTTRWRRGGEPTAGKPCGTLWIEMRELIGFDEEAARISSSR